MFRHYLKLAWVLLASIPPIPTARIWPVLFFLLGFVSLRNLNLPETEAFVMAAVITQVAVIWRNLPDAARELRRVGVQSMTVLRYGVAASIAAAAAQLLLNDPTITQRMISMSCVVYAGAMLWGVLGNARIRDLVVPSPSDRPVPEAPRVHLLRMNVLAALGVLVVNEAMVAAAMDLATRVSILALLPLAIHVAYEVIVLLTLPLEDA